MYTTFHQFAHCHLCWYSASPMAFLSLSLSIILIILSMIHSIQSITWTLIIMTNRFISQHLLDNSIFASTFSPEPILGIIGQSGKSSDLVSDQKLCYIAPVLKRGWLDTSVYLARPSWFHLGQSADGVLPTLEFPTLTDLTTFLFNFELWASHWLGGRQTQRGRQTCTA